MIRLFLLIGFCLCFRVLSFAQDELPNIILIVSDDQGWGDLSLNGNPNISTPNLDALARGGAVFNNFYVSPVCSPTRAELLTGKYHVRLGVQSTSEGGERFDKDVVTIADVLKSQDYKTAAFGKWHSGSQAPYHPNSRGFDEFYGFTSGHWGNYFSPMLEHNGQVIKGEGFLPDDLSNQAMKFIEENAEERFFVYLPYNTPHSPMQVPDLFFDRQAEKNLVNFSQEKTAEDTLFTKAALAMVENLDWNIGRLCKKIDSLGIENTLIIFLSDNGPNNNRWNGEMRGKKGSTDEGGVRSPLILNWKGVIEANTIYENITSAVDLMPSILEVLGKPNLLPYELDGFSFFHPKMDRVIINDWKNQCSIRSQDFRLDNENRLYNISEDRSQKEDVSNDYPDEKAQLLKIKMDWIDNVKTTSPTSMDLEFTIGHPSMTIDHLPARDAKFTGGIKRSNRWPNCSFLTQWTNSKEEIYWNIDVLQAGTYEVEFFYTCSQENLGSEIQVVSSSDRIQKRIDRAFDPPLVGVDQDRIVRMESYTKDFASLQMGSIYLDEGKQRLVLKSTEVKNKEVADFRLLILKRNEVD